MENQNSYTEVTSQSWGSRIMGSIKSVLFGIVLFLAAFIVLWWNEGRAVKTAKGLEEGAGVVIRADANAVDASNSGKLVHLSGKVVSEEVLADPEFGLEVNALKLRRTVEMYQWVEETETKKEKELGGSEKTTTTYNYKKEWNVSLVNSGDFKVSDGHANPSSMPYEEQTLQVSNAAIGSYELSSSLLSKMGSFSNLSLTGIDTTKIKNARLINDGGQKFYIGKGSPSTPEVGDVKVSFQVVNAGEDYSLIAKQVENSFESYTTSTGTSIEMITAGAVSPESMFETAQRNNTITTWILRLVGFLMMFFGFSMVFRPLVVVADVVPFLGSLLGMGLSLFSGILTFALSFVTIAIAWIFYRPVLGISLLAVGVGVFAFFYLRASKKKKLAPVPA